MGGQLAHQRRAGELLVRRLQPEIGYDLPAALLQQPEAGRVLHEPPKQIPHVCPGPHQETHLPADLAHVPADLAEHGLSRAISRRRLLHQVGKTGLAHVLRSLTDGEDAVPLLDKALQQRRIGVIGQPEGRRLPQIPPRAGQPRVFVAGGAQILRRQLPLGKAAQIQQKVVQLHRHLRDAAVAVQIAHAEVGAQRVGDDAAAEIRRSAAEGQLRRRRKGGDVAVVGHVEGGALPTQRPQLIHETAQTGEGSFIVDGGILPHALGLGALAAHDPVADHHVRKADAQHVQRHAGALGHGAGHLLVAGVLVQRRLKRRCHSGGAAGHQLHQQHDGAGDPLGYEAGGGVPVVFLHAHQPSVHRHRRLDVGAADIDAAAYAAAASLHRPPQPGQQVAAARYLRRGGNVGAPVTDGKGERAAAKRAAQAVGNVDDFAVTAAGGLVHLKNIVQFAQQRDDFCFPQVQIEGHFPAAESGQGVEYEGGDVLLHELPLFSVRPTGDGQGEVPPRAVAQRQLHGDGHVIRQCGALFPHIAEPDALTIPGLL